MSVNLFVVLNIKTCSVLCFWNYTVFWGCLGLNMICVGFKILYLSYLCVD